MPVADILTVIIAARGVCFSGESLSALLKNNACILHCDENYRPIGKTIGLHRLVHIGTFETQIKMQETLLSKLWHKILLIKIQNQAYILDLINKDHKIWDYIADNGLDEGNIARHYWSIYFKYFGRKAPKTREHQGATNPINGMLNYGYAVVSAILHRYILAHGLNTTLGIHHKYRFRSDPMVYDLVEPLRPLVDLMLLRYRLENPREDISSWVKHCAKDILSARITFDGKKKFTLPAAIDFYVSSIANFYRFNNLDDVQIPTLKGIKFEE